MALPQTLPTSIRNAMAALWAQAVTDRRKARTFHGSTRIQVGGREIKITLQIDADQEERKAVFTIQDRTPEP